MSASIAIPFPIGATVWHAEINREAELVTCPSCAGTLKHSVTLGNGETHVVWCSDCSASHAFDYEYATSDHLHPGKVKRYTVRAEVRQVVLGSVDIRGDEVTYYESPRPSGLCLYSGTLFATEQEAMHHSATVLTPKAAKEEEERFVLSFGVRFTRKNTVEKAASSARWWRERRKKAESDLAAINARLARLNGGAS